MNAYQAAALPDLHRISCTETGFREQNHFQAQAGQTYYFQVSDTTYSLIDTPNPVLPDQTASLIVRANAPIPNTTFATATAIGTLPATVHGSNSLVDANWYEPYASCYDDRALMGTLWYRYAPAATGPVLIDVGDSYYDADFAVWDSDGTTPGAFIGCPDQPGPHGDGPYDKTHANLELNAVSGKTYFIQVGSTSFGAGDFVMELSTLKSLAAATPTIGGTARNGETLTAQPGAWGPQPVSFTYQWQQNRSPIFGATSARYAVTDGDIGRRLSVIVTGHKDGYATVSKESTETAVATPGTLTPGTVTIAGTVAVGRTVTANSGSWAPQPVTYLYQWNRSGAAISGATYVTYIPTGSDAGKPLTVTLTASKPGYTSRIVTSAATTVARGTLTGSTPTITGSKKVGAVLTANAGTWGPAPVTLTYRWTRNGIPISGATRAIYTLTSTDRGKTITVAVVGTKSGYNPLLRISSATTRIQ